MVCMSAGACLWTQTSLQWQQASFHVKFSWVLMNYCESTPLRSVRHCALNFVLRIYDVGSICCLFDSQLESLHLCTWTNLYFGIVKRECKSCAQYQARSELRFWRGAEVDKVQNPKQLYVINLVKIRKIGNFWQRLKKLVIFLVRRRRKLRFFAKFLEP